MAGLTAEAESRLDQVTPRRNPIAKMSAPQLRKHIRAVGRITAISVVLSELITFVLLLVLVDGEILAEGLLIALICSGPISAWIADRQLRLRHMISEQHDRLAQLNVELNARNSDLDAFARAVAHDLRSPLATIIGTADLLAEDSRFADDAETVEFIRSIIRSGEQATEIIEGLLVLHGIRHENPELAPVDTDATVDNALETMTRAIADRHAVVTRPPALPPVSAYGPWLTQVWINLIGNAIKYGGSPPKVDVAAAATPDGRVRFEVIDNGAGVAPDDRDRIFHEFERGRSETAEGHGLGLAIVNRVVSRLDGETGLDNADGGGSVFWFTVPAA